MKNSKNFMKEDKNGFQDDIDEIPDHEVESAAHDLMRAEKHKSNHKLMKKVHAHLHSQKKQISSIQDLKQVANEKMKSHGAEEMGESPSKKENESDE